MQQKSNVFTVIGTNFGAEVQVFMVCFFTALDACGWDLCLLLFLVKMSAWLIRKKPLCYTRERHLIIEEERKGAPISHWLLGVVPVNVERLRVPNLMSDALWRVVGWHWVA